MAAAPSPPIRPCLRAKTEAAAAAARTKEDRLNCSVGVRAVCCSVQIQHVIMT